MNERYSKIRSDLSAALMTPLEDVRKRAEMATAAGKISTQDLAALSSMIQHFNEQKSPTQVSNLHDLLKFTVKTKVTHDEQTLEHLMYRLYDLGIPSMWGPVIR